MSKVGSYIGMIVTIGILADLMTTTFELARIDKGLNSSLSSTSQLVSIEQTVTQKNQALGGLLKTTQQMSKQLGGLADTTSGIHQNISEIGQLNADTLKLNIEQESIAANSGQTLGQVIASLTSLEHATQSLSTALSGLDRVIQEDRSNLDQLRSATRTMDQKTPGV